MQVVIKSVLLLLLAVAFFLAGVLVPEQLRSVQDAVLAAAGGKAPSLPEQVENEMDAARAGSAGLLLEAYANELPDLEERRADLLAAKPSYRLTGGPAPYLEAFLELLRLEAPADSGPGPVSTLLMARADRETLHRILSRSGNAVVQVLLDARDMPGMTLLQPASRPGGGPFDASLLTAALLVQGGHFSPESARELKELASAAGDGDLAAVRGFEAFSLATLSLAKRLPYDALVRLAEESGGLPGWNASSGLFRAFPGKEPAVYTAVVLTGDAEGVAAYLRRHPERGYEDLLFALQMGEGAVRELLERGLPRYRPAPFVARIERFLAPLRMPWLAGISRDAPGAMRMIKFLLFLGAGWSVALAFGAVWRGQRGGQPRLGRLNPFVLARDGLTGLAGALIAWMVIEPGILRGAAEQPASGLRLDFSMAASLESIKSPFNVMQSINQVTVLVLALFFVIQLIIYALCLIKLREIRREKGSASLKLNLLENEEYLFDFGLYVGLGGTVASLILVAIGIVEASLMAAYASTLFGILFVALLKVFHVRPMRRQLILEAEGRG